MHARICVTVDVDPDDATFGQGNIPLTWLSLERLPAIRQTLAGFGCPVTWFLRCDEEVADCHGSYVFLYEREKQFWDAARAAGDELGVHPHFCTMDLRSGRYMRTHNPNQCRTQLTRVHEALEQRGIRLSSIRIGESFHCNEVMKLVDELGYRVDSTAMPGRRRQDSERNFDWVGTPNRPYHPSLADYRHPGPAGLSVLEVPMTTMLFKADFDSRPMLRYASLTYRPDIFAAGVRDHLGNSCACEDVILVFIIHPAELDERRACDVARSLYSQSMLSLGRNVEFILQKIEQRGGTYSFSTLSGLALELAGLET